MYFPKVKRKTQRRSKLDTGENTSENREIQGFENNKGVSNLENTPQLESNEKLKQMLATEDDAMKLIQELFDEGYNVNLQESGTSDSGTRHKMAIAKPNTDDKLKALKEKMSLKGYKLVNTGAYGTLFFQKPLREGQQ